MPWLCYNQRMKTFIEAFGWYGTFAILLAYALSSFAIIATTNPLYQILNITGSIGIVAVAVTKKDHQSATLNVIWAIIGLVALVKLFV